MGNVQVLYSTFITYLSCAHITLNVRERMLRLVLSVGKVGTDVLGDIFILFYILRVPTFGK